MTIAEIAGMSPVYKERFWKYVDRRGVYECWPWLGSTIQGYGQMAINFRESKKSSVARAHRISFILNGGDFSKGYIVRHLCGNPTCVNPAHLRAGTSQDNMDDMIQHGRAALGDKNGSHTHPERRATGARHGSKTHPERIWRNHGAPVKLSESSASAIRMLYADGNISMRKLAKKFGVSHETVNLVVKGRIWKGLSETSL